MEEAFEILDKEDGFVFEVVSNRLQQANCLVWFSCSFVLDIWQYSSNGIANQCILPSYKWHEQYK